MASIHKRGENSYLLVVSRGYDYQGNRLKPAQKTVHPPKGLTAKQTEKWLNEQAVLYEREVKHTPGESVDRSITLAKYIDVWLEQVAPKKLAASTLVPSVSAIRRSWIPVRVTIHSSLVSNNIIFQISCDVP